jgi:predicted glycoside hydrolase/deacetylase ChbG (UPF0249 family)
MEHKLKSSGMLCGISTLVLCAVALLTPRPAGAQEGAASPAAGTHTDLRRGDKAPLAVRLGFRATDKILIIIINDAGMSHAANRAVMQGLESGLTTSATVMVPCSWFYEIATYAKAHPKADLGVHLTLTSEWKFYKWGPVASKDKVKNLLDIDGNLWPHVEDVYAHSNPQEAETEARAQISKALKAGIDITHLDSHMRTLHFRPDFHQVYAS